jgi:hypothetical protein
MPNTVLAPAWNVISSMNVDWHWRCIGRCNAKVLFLALHYNLRMMKVMSTAKYSGEPKCQSQQSTRANASSVKCCGMIGKQRPITALRWAALMMNEADGMQHLAVRQR